MLDKDKYKQNKNDNLTRKSFRELIVLNKADNSSTIVVEDREKYASNAILHLNDPNIYKPLDTDISH